MCTVLAKRVVCNRVQSTAMNRELKCPQWQEPLYVTGGTLLAA
jgi:hypothetical protein